MVVSRPTQRVHDSTSSPFGTLILDTARAIQECSAGADEGETGVSLTGGSSSSPILSYERVHSELGGIQGAVKIHFDCLQAGRLRGVLWTYFSGISFDRDTLGEWYCTIVREYFVIDGNASICDNVIDGTKWCHGGRYAEEIDLVVPVRDVASDEFDAWKVVSTHQ